MVPSRDIPSRRMEQRASGGSGVLTEEIVPVFGGGAQALDGGMKGARLPAVSPGSDRTDALRGSLSAAIVGRGRKRVRAAP